MTLLPVEDVYLPLPPGAIWGEMDEDVGELQFETPEFVNKS